jgi:hypothetical protein
VYHDEYATEVVQTDDDEAIFVNSVFWIVNRDGI